jgi:amino-acid N-acetyltransferase
MIRKARISDVKDIHSLLTYFAGKQMLLARSLSDLYENVRDFFVIEEEGHVIGAGALHIIWEDLAEIRSLAIKEEFQRAGLGSGIISFALAEAREYGIKKVFTLTYQPEFFKKNGFNIIDKSQLPHKIWADCIRCPRFPNCDEIAMMMELN